MLLLSTFPLSFQPGIKEGQNDCQRDSKGNSRTSELYSIQVRASLQAFILGAEDSSTKEEIEAYREAHPHTHVVILYQRDYGSGGLE